MAPLPSPTRDGSNTRLPKFALKDVSAPPLENDVAASILTASSPAEVRAALTTLHKHESAITSRLDSLRAEKDDLSRSLARLDNLRARLGAQVIGGKNISSNMLAGVSDTAAHLSGHIHSLDLEKQRVEDTLRVVEQVMELKACVAGVAGSMGAPQDWEAAAVYLARAAKIPDDILRGSFAAAVVPTIEIPDPPWVSLEAARESLCTLFIRESKLAAGEADDTRTRFFKLFPLIGKGDVGLDVYGWYICQGVADTARAVLRDGLANRAGEKDGFFYAKVLTKLFEHIARIVDGHRSLVNHHYGTGQMVRVIERLQAEADVQGGIVIDSWSEERSVDRKLTDIKSYPFSFLVQSLLPQQSDFGRVSRTNSPAPGNSNNNVENSDDEGVNMKEIDGLLSEIAVMLGRWSLYSRFLARECRDPEWSPNEPLAMPDLLVKSDLSRKVNARLTVPYIAMMTFFFRRSVEKAFQLDETPAGLSLSMSKPIKGVSPPFIISAVDDVMFLVDTVLRKSISTAQHGVTSQLISIVSSVLGSNFIGIIQRRMSDEVYPHVVQSQLPPENRIIMLIVLANSLDMANEYLSRIVHGLLGSSTATTSGTTSTIASVSSSIRDSFPFQNDAEDFATRLRGLHNSFSSKATELRNESVQVLFNHVIKPRLRSILTDTFRDANYGLSEEELLELATQSDEDEEALGGLVARRFERGWGMLMPPIARLMTARTFSVLLDITARHLAQVLEKRLLGYRGRITAYGVICMERDFGNIVATVSKGGYYAVREAFGKTMHLLMVANMDDKEWEVLEASPDKGGVDWVLSKEEILKARNMTKRD